MGVCKECGEVKNVIDMVDGVCSQCRPQETSKEESTVPLDEPISSSDKGNSSSYPNIIMTIGLILLSILTFSTLFQTQSISSQKPSCYMTSSQGDQSKMTNFDLQGYMSQQPIVKNYKYVNFTDAYNEFYSSLTSTISEDCKKKKVDGATNIKVNWQVGEKSYYFTATYDYFEWR